MPATLALQTPESQQAHNIRCKPYRQFVGYAGLGCSNRRHVECTPFVGLLNGAFFHKLSPVLNWTHL